MSRHLRPSGGRAVVRVVAATLVAAATSLVVVPAAHADSQTTLMPTAEAWYQPNPSCGAPTGCSPAGPPPSSPYPAGTMHVGLTAKQETARTFLALPFATVSEMITGGTLTVPLDVTQNDGSSNPSTAKIQVCLTSASVTAVEGSFDSPPKVDCSTAVPAAYVALPTPHLEADLGAIVSKLSAATGLALLPDASKAAATDSWRVVFSTPSRTDAAKTAPATATLSIADPPANSPDQPPVVTLPDSSNQTFGGIEPAAGTGFAAPPAVDVPAVQAPAVTTPQIVAPVTAPVSAGQTITVGYAYPIVWLLPLAFLLLVPLAARALTRDLSPVSI